MEEETLFETRYGKYTLVVEAASYAMDQSLAISVTTKSGEPFGKLSVHLENHPCGPNAFFAKEWSENRDWAPALLKAMEEAGIIKATGRVASTGFVDSVREFILVK